LFVCYISGIAFFFIGYRPSFLLRSSEQLEKKHCIEDMGHCLHILRSQKERSFHWIPTIIVTIFRAARSRALHRRLELLNSLRFGLESAIEHEYLMYLVYLY
jgi:hypothetical protein